MKKIICMIVFVMLFQACSSGGSSRTGSSRTPVKKTPQSKLPVWVAHPPAFPGKIYAVGAGKDHKRAVDNGRNEIVAQLEVSVEGDRSSTTRVSESYDGKDFSGKVESNILDKIRTKTSMQGMSGIVLDRSAQVGADYFVLMAFDTNAWGNMLKDKVLKLDDDIKTAKTEHDKRVLDNPLAVAVKLYERVVPLALEREELARKHALSKSGNLPKMPVDLSKIKTYLSSVLSDISVSLPSDPSVAPLESTIVDSLGKLGIRVLEKNSNSVFVLELKFSFTEQKVSTMLRVDGVLTGTLTEKETGRKLCGINISERSASSNKGRAIQGLYKKLSKKLSKTIDEKIVKYLANY